MPPLPYRLSLNIPPPLLLAELPEMVVLEKSIGPPFLTPPPLLAAFPEIVVFVTIKVPLFPYRLSLLIPPPLLVAVFPDMFELLIVNGPALLIAPPESLLVLLDKFVLSMLKAGDDTPYLLSFRMPPPLPPATLF